MEFIIKGVRGVKTVRSPNHNVEVAWEDFCITVSTDSEKEATEKVFKQLWDKNVHAINIHTVDQKEITKEDLTKFIKREMDWRWAAKSTFISDSFSKLREDFNEKAIPMLAKIVSNTEEARIAACIFLSRVKIEWETLKYRDLGYPLSHYDHHLYPTCYDLDDKAHTVAIGFKDEEAFTLLNNPEELQRLITEELAKRGT